MMPSKHHVLRGLFELYQSDPNRVLFSFVDEQGKDIETRTAAQLVQRIERLASYLNTGCGLSPGDTALLIYPPSMEFIEAFAACLLAGVIAAPVYPPNLAKPQNDLQRLNAVAASSGAKAMLTNRAYRWASRLTSAKELISGSTPRWPALPWYVTQGLGWFQSKIDYPHECQLDDVAILQFTSGSTSTPKGVRLTHRNLIHQLNLNAELLGIETDSRLVMWVPQYHDLGLISGIMAVLRGRGSLWFMSPLSFLKRPRIWFDTIHRVRGTHTASPNFGYELASKKTNPEMRSQWDLTSVRIFMNAAEPIIALTMDKFIEDFAVTGLSSSAFCPAYGMAEHTVGVTLGGKKRLKIDRQTLVSKQFARIETAGDLELVGCGSPRSGVNVKVVAPKTGEVLSDRYVGEIWVQSDSVADGYQGLAELSHKTFKAILANEPGYWMRTGDLGFFHENELFITGRQKDLIIIRGRNMHPEDIEESIRRVHPGVRSGGVVSFSVPGNATEELVVLAEVNDPTASNLDEIVLAIKRRLSEVWQIQSNVALVNARSLKKTTSGKIQRAACRQAWIDNKFHVLNQNSITVSGSLVNLDFGEFNANLNDIALEDRVDWVLGLIQKLAQSKLSSEVSHIGPDDFLPDVGLDSLTSAELISALEQSLDCSLPTALFIEHPTLRSAAMRILSEKGIEFLGGIEPVENLEPLPFRPAHRSLSPASTSIAIIGGGVGGLISALELVRCGYRNITIFESEREVGGKVLTKTIGEEHIELGQNFFGDSFRDVLQLVNEMGCKTAPIEHTFLQWDEQYGFEETPVRRAAKPWFQSIAKAARIPMNTKLPFPSLFEQTDMPFNRYLQKHSLRSPHPLFLFDWNAMGYGMDTDVSAAYVAPYINVVGALGSSCYLSEGNQSLWIRLAKHLQSEWGVTILLGEKVTYVRGDDKGVNVEIQNQKYRFDELILAVPPNQLAGFLDKHDPLQHFLGEFQYYSYGIRSFKAEGLLKSGALYMPQFASTPGRTFLIQACHQHQGWYICGQYGSSFAPNPEPIANEILNQEVAELVQKIGGQITEFGPQQMWTHYFPHLRDNATAVLRQIESLQGRRHIWATGSWLSFETTEHVARHAKHLIHTCFDPAFAPSSFVSREVNGVVLVD